MLHDDNGLVKINGHNTVRNFISVVCYCTAISNKKYFRLWPIWLLLAHYSFPYSRKLRRKATFMITHSRDRPIFIRNFPRWRADASWIWFNRK